MIRWSIIRCRMSTLLLPTICNGQQDIYKQYSIIWYLHTKAKILIDCLLEASRRPVQNSYVCKLLYTERKKLSHFDIKSWVTCGTKIRPGKVGNWRIFESNWLNIKSQIDSTLRVKLTQHSESNWLNIESQIDSTLRVYIGSTLRVKLAQHWDSSWLNIESQIDSTLRVKLIQHWELNWLNIESQIDSTMRVKLTQIFSSYSLCSVEL